MTYTTDLIIRHWRAYVARNKIRATAGEAMTLEQRGAGALDSASGADLAAASAPYDGDCPGSHVGESICRPLTLL